MSRIQRMRNVVSEADTFVKEANVLVKTAAKLTSDGIDMIAEIGAFIPIAEIVVTIASFYAAGLGQQFGIEVLIGLVFAQVAALFNVAHYRDEAMSKIGLFAIYASVFIGAINTGTAVFMAVTAHEGNIAAWVWRVPAYSTALAILLMYAAKLFTMERVYTRERLAVQATARMKEMERKANSDMAKANALDKMQQTRLNMQADSLDRLATDPRIAYIQDLAMFTEVVKDIMTAFDIRSNSKLGKQLMELAEQAAKGDGNAIENMSTIQINGNGQGDFLASMQPITTNGNGAR